MIIGAEVRQQLNDFLKSSAKVLIAAAPGNDDAVAAALALGEVFGRGGKTVTIAHAGKLSERIQSLPGHEKIIASVTKNFVISLKGAVGNVEKVSYYTEGNDLHLVIHPKPNAPAFSSDKITYSDGSSGFDLIIVIGVANLADLGSVYSEDPGLYTAQIVNIDLRQENSRFGKVNLVDSQASSLSEMVGSLIQALGLTLTQDAATALLAGLDIATNGFSSSQVTAEAFEAAAASLRAGGRRSGTGAHPPVREDLGGQPPGARVGTSSVPASGSLPQEVKPLQPPPAPTAADSEAGEKVGSEPKSQAEKEANWLQPKIYKGGQLL